MKKMILGVALIAAIVSCRKYPDFNTLSYQPIVATKHDSSISFSNYKTYYMANQLTQISDDPKDSLVPAEKGDPVVKAIADNMAARGYKRVLSTIGADLGINSAVLKITSTVVTYPPYYWWGYPGYGGCYYGYCGGYYPYYPYYGYGYSYQYETGTLLLEMADLMNVDTVHHQINIIWTNYNTGVLSSYSSTNVQAAVDAVNQAFSQSAYIKTN